jgi:DNA-binding transcriptional LysR family regulator
MNIDNLKAFEAVYQTGGFSAASKVIFRSQPAVSLAVKTLEADLGVRLFERFGPLKVKPTKEGVLLHELASPLLKDLDGLRKRFDAAVGRAGSNEIRIATHEAVISYVFPDIVEAFTRKYPDLKFTMIRSNKEDIVKQVLSGDVDFGITTVDQAPRGIEFRVFREHKRVLITQKGHPLTKIRTITPKDLAGYPFILPPKQSETRALVDDFFAKKRLKHTVALEMTGRDAVKNYVEKGLGISIMTDYYLFPHDMDRLAIKDLSQFFGKTTRDLLWRKGKVFTKVQEELKNHLLEPKTR